MRSGGGHFSNNMSGSSLVFHGTFWTTDPILLARHGGCHKSNWVLAIKTVTVRRVTRTNEGAQLHSPSAPVSANCMPDLITYNCKDFTTHFPLGAKS